MDYKPVSSHSFFFFSCGYCLVRGMYYELLETMFKSCISNESKYWNIFSCGHFLGVEVGEQQNAIQ